MRVCFLTHYYPPEVGAPQTRIELLARTLAARGQQVAVHTCFPHYPSGTIRLPYRNRPWIVERQDGVTIVRSAVLPAPNRGFGRRLTDHASFAASALATAPLTGPLDVVVAETPPLFTAAAGALYAALKRAALVVHVADRWPASAVELGALRGRHAIAAAGMLEDWVYRHADMILTPTAGLHSALEAVPGCAPKTRRVWPVVDLVRFNLPDPGDQGGPLRLLYAGTVGLAQGLHGLVEASRLAGPDVVRTTIAGDGAEAERIHSLAHRRDAANVTLIGAVRSERVPALYAAADAAVVLLRDLPIFTGALPTKMFEAMAAGRPLVLAVRGEAARLVEEAGAGIVVAPDDPAALAHAIRRLHGDPALRRRLGRAGRSYAEARFGTERASAQWASALSEAGASRLEHARRSATALATRYRAG